MEPADGGDAAEKSSFRWTDAARYVAASVVAVLIVVVVVNAINMVVHPPQEPLFFSVIGSSVPMAGKIPSSSRPTLVLQLGLGMINPSALARAYFVNITGYLFDKNVSAGSLDPSSDCIVSFFVKDKEVAPEKIGIVASLEIKAKRGENMLASYFDALYYGNGSTIFGGVTLRLDGTLISEPRLGWNEYSIITYYCPQLLVGGHSPDDEVFKNRLDVVCVNA